MSATLSLMERMIPASRFKAQCLALLDEVAETGQTIIVTKRGKAVARITPLEQPASLLGSVTFSVADEELIAPIDVEWDAMHGRL